MTRDITVMTWS